MKHTLVIAAYAALAASSSLVLAENPLGVAEVKALITGNTVYMQNLENTGENCGKIQKNTDGTYTRIGGGAPAFKWLTITPGKDF